jgi:hypothetical protein
MNQACLVRLNITTIEFTRYNARGIFLLCRARFYATALRLIGFSGKIKFIKGWSDK